MNIYRRTSQMNYDKTSMSSSFMIIYEHLQKDINELNNDKLSMNFIL